MPIDPRIESQRELEIASLVKYRQEHGFPPSHYEDELIRWRDVPEWAWATAEALRRSTGIDVYIGDLEIAKILMSKMSELGYCPVKISVGVWTPLAKSV